MKKFKTHLHDQADEKIIETYVFTSDKAFGRQELVSTTYKNKPAFAVVPYNAKGKRGSTLHWFEEKLARQYFNARVEEDKNGKLERKVNMRGFMGM